MTQPAPSPPDYKALYEKLQGTVRDALLSNGAPAPAVPAHVVTLPEPVPLVTIQAKTINKKAIIDLVERASATFAQSFLAVGIADHAQVSQLEALKIAATAGALAVAKFGYAKTTLYLAKNQGA